MLTSSLDVRRPGDLNLVYRAMLNNWPMSNDVLESVLLQMGDLVATPGTPPKMVIKLSRMIQIMTEHCIADLWACEGRVCARPRRRSPEKRRPRRR